LTVDRRSSPENKPQVIISLVKGLHLKRIEDAEEGYQSVVSIYEREIYPSVDGVRNVIRLRRQRKLRRLTARELVDYSVVRRLEKECDSNSHTTLVEEDL
jgi:hypothetical protein